VVVNTYAKALEAVFPIACLYKTDRVSASKDQEQKSTTQVGMWY